MSDKLTANELLEQNVSNAVSRFCVILAAGAQSFNNTARESSHIGVSHGGNLAARECWLRQ